MALIGGIGIKANGDFPEKILIDLSFKVRNSTRDLMVVIKLLKMDSAGIEQHAVLQIPTEYAALARFAPSLHRMLDEPGCEAVLGG